MLSARICLFCGVGSGLGHSCVSKAQPKVLRHLFSSLCTPAYICVLFPQSIIHTIIWQYISYHYPLFMKQVHTPDSNRYWIANSYEYRFISGLEPENVDKEFLRLWFKNNCNPYEDTVYFLHTVVRITCEFCSIMIQLIFF
uniref:phosphoribosylaminoimidazolesuccinocarboxamide synthase n=1 Tax=Zea mays TaxID=4577 RepID=A0A804Q4J4_MAIZE